MRSLLHICMKRWHRPTMSPVISFSRLYPRFLFPGVRQNDVSGTAIKKHPAEQIIDCLNPFTWVRAARRAASLQPDMLVFTWWNPFFGPIVRHHRHAVQMDDRQTSSDHRGECYFP